MLLACAGDPALDVLADHEQRRRGLRVRDAAGVEHHERRVCRDRRRPVGEVGVGAVADVVVQAHREVAQALGDPDRPLAALLVVAALKLLLQQQLAWFLAGQRAARIDLGDREPEQVRLKV